MSNQFICNICPLGSTTYPTLFAMQEHIKQIHISERRSGLASIKVREIEQAKVKEVTRVSTVPLQDQKPEQLPTEPKRKPIVLEYKYTGIDICGQEVVTLEAEIDGKYFVIAYCLKEQKQVEVREVAKLYDNKIMSNLSSKKKVLPKLS